MRKLRRFLAIGLSTILLGSCLVGCGGKSNGSTGNNSTTEIEIAVWNSGLGVEWLENLKKGFEVKYPDYKVRYTATASAAATLSAYGLEDVDTVDLYFTHMSGNNSKYMEPLDDILSTTVEGEEKSLGEKFIGSYLETEKNADGHTYRLTYGGGVISFVYNKDLFTKAGINQLPRTTNEFIAVCDTLHGKGITPLCHFTQGGYYEFLLNLYVAQHDGYDYFINNLYANADDDGTTPSEAALAKKDGRYQALKVFEKFITPEYTLLGSNTKSHTEIQTEFINGQAAMMLNGSWLKNEMASAGTVDNLSEMRAPVISSITQRLSTIKSDLELRKVITAVDQVADGEKQESDFATGENYVIDDLTISAEDWKSVYEARNMVATNYSGLNAFIPNYSNCKEGAKLFLQYMYSDEGIKIYTETIGVPLPILLSNGESIDVSSLTEFEQFQFQVVKNSEYFVEISNASQSRLFTDGAVNIMANVTYVDKMSSQNDRDRMSADEIWQLIQDTIEHNFELNWVKNIK